MVYQHKLGKINKAKQRLIIALTVLVLIALPLLTVVMTPRSALAISTSTALTAALADPGQSTINLSGNVTVSESLVINRPVAINGNGYTISSNFAGTDDNNATISIRSTSGVTLSNLIVDGSGGSNIHGINIWRGTNVNLESITVKNHTDGKYGVVVGASSIANINNITTVGNSFGINIDVGDDTSETPPTLNVTGVSEHNEFLHMAKESGTVNDINGQYDHYEVGASTGYILKTVHLSPANGVVLRAGDEIKPTWKPVNSDAVAGYEYRVAKNGSVDSEGKLNVDAFEWPLFIYNGRDNAQHNGTGTADGTYFWQVRNLYKVGTLEVKGAWTTPWSTTVDTSIEPEPPIPSASNFIGSPRYVRQNSTGPAVNQDLVAQVRVPIEATDVRFTVSGELVTDSDKSEEKKDNDIFKANGAPAGSQWWRLQKALPTGEHPVTGEFLVNGNWYPITGNSTTYSLGAPTASYTYPSDSRYIFRPSDNPIRIKVGDQYEQFRDMQIFINGTSYTVSRDKCDLRQAGNYLLCDINESDNWAALAAGTYTARATVYNKANSRLDNLISREFIIDNSGPIVTNFTAPSSARNLVTVSATVTDDNEVDSVKFFMANPDEGVCKNNLASILEAPGILSDNDTYTAELNVSELNGQYCILVTARDKATHSSVALFRAITIDQDDDEQVTSPPIGDGSGSMGSGNGTTGGSLSAVGQNTGSSSQVTSTTTGDSGQVFGAFTNFATTFDDGLVSATPLPIDEAPVEDSEAEILGAQDQLGDTAAGQNQSGPLKALGIMWYWWLAAFALFLTTWWVIAAKRRKDSENA